MFKLINMSNKLYMSLIFFNLAVIKTLSSNHRMFNFCTKVVKILEICKRFAENLVNESGNVPRRSVFPYSISREIPTQLLHQIIQQQLSTANAFRKEEWVRLNNPCLSLSRLCFVFLITNLVRFILDSSDIWSHLKCVSLLIALALDDFHNE